MASGELTAARVDRGENVRIRIEVAEQIAQRIGNTGVQKHHGFKVWVFKTLLLREISSRPRQACTFR